MLADIEVENGESTAQGIRQRGDQARFVKADISQEADAKKITDEALAAFGQVNILVNDAAALVLNGFDASQEEWQRSPEWKLRSQALYRLFASKRSKSWSRPFRCPPFRRQVIAQIRNPQACLGQDGFHTATSIMLRRYELRFGRGAPSTHRRRPGSRKTGTLLIGIALSSDHEPPNVPLH